MRHGDKLNNLGRKSAHRKAMLANMASSLILHKRISTTVAKAKALRLYVEPLLTKSKDDSTHSRRTVFAYLGNKEAVDMLFKDVATKIADRPGGYTRILKTGGATHRRQPYFLAGHHCLRLAVSLPVCRQRRCCRMAGDRLHRARHRHFICQTRRHGSNECHGRNDGLAAASRQTTAAIPRGHDHER